MAAAPPRDDVLLVPLRKWVESEAKKQTPYYSSAFAASSSSSSSGSGNNNNKNGKNNNNANNGGRRPRAEERRRGREALLRKTTVAYGITELLRRARDVPLCDINNNDINDDGMHNEHAQTEGATAATTTTTTTMRRRTGVVGACGGGIVGNNTMMMRRFDADDFAVRVSCASSSAEDDEEHNRKVFATKRGRWRCGVEGVEMLSPKRMTAIVAEPYFLMEGFAIGGGGGCDDTGGDVCVNDDDSDAIDGDDGTLGRYLEVEFLDGSNNNGGAFGNNNGACTAPAVDQSEEDARCHSLGALLYELFSHLSPFPAEWSRATSSSKKKKKPTNNGETQMQKRGPPRKRARPWNDDSGNNGGKRRSSKSKSKSNSWDDSPSVAPDGTVLRRSSSSTSTSTYALRPPRAATVRGMPYFPLSDLGFPSSVCQLVRNLLDCGESSASYNAGGGDDDDDDEGRGGGDDRPDDAYESLDVASGDLHLLLLDPCRFLFDREVGTTSSSTSKGGNDDAATNGESDKGGDEGGAAGKKNNNNNAIVAQPLFRRHKIYGREDEVTSITDAFCRVSGGISEAFFIGGFSGSGKSRLVNSLIARVDAAEGYVLTHKFDQMSKERPLLAVIAAMDRLCLLVKARRSPGELRRTAEELVECFGGADSSFAALARLLPNVRKLDSRLDDDYRLGDNNNRSGSSSSSARGEDQGEGSSSPGVGGGIDQQTDLRSVCFTLRRFLRVVSGGAHPVMLFLDDLQWCDDSALAVVEGMLCDSGGSGRLFFVGSYRSNEVPDGHALFPLMEGLRNAGVPTTRLNLEGLTPEDLNTMVSDALCMFPRICEPLSDIVFQKTKGNPFFVLEFLRSLVDGALLEYDTRRRRWVWDEDRIGSMDITGNVLHLLSSKMIGLSGDTQLALKVAACFGIRMKESVVGILGADPRYADLRTGLEHVVAEGFMIKVGDFDFKFVHDKVREAAYGLIPDNEKNQYHYSLGMTLYSMTKGANVDDIIFAIADQVNHGTGDLLVQSPQLRLAFAELNEMAGGKAVYCSDYVTARSYLNRALSLLPADHWMSRYDQSRRLYFLLAKSSYSCGDVEKAQGILQEILGECRCTKDKLHAYFLLVNILYSVGQGADAYDTCQDVLIQLGETIPLSFDFKEKKRMIEATSKAIKDTSETDLLEMQQMDEDLSISLKFYSLMATVAFFTRPDMFAFLTCRMVNLTMRHGICKYSLMGFVQHAAMMCGCGNNVATDIQGASRIGKIAMSAFKKRFHSPEQLPKVYFCYYGLVAFHTEALQSCADMLGQGFNAGMSIGESGTAFLNSVQHIKTSLIAGEKLPTLLDKVDYYLELAVLYKNELSTVYLGIFRDTISMLIDKGESTSSKKNPDSGSAMKPDNMPSTMYFHRAIQSYWLGHNERCHHYITKVLQMSSATGRLSDTVMTFIHGLNSFQVPKRQNTGKLRAIPKNSIMELKTATSHSRWNFRNKVHLLEAENFSNQGNHEEAKASYAAAITSARCSRFVHEQGLACELAGNHYKKFGDDKSAWSFFNQAKQCYAEWGSQMKVDSIARKLESFQIM